MRRISIIIPVLNEEKILEKSLLALQSIKDERVEVVVVDGGSADDTVSIAERYADQVIQSEVGRAKQLNKGAGSATGDLYLFLHADTILPPNAFDGVQKISNEEYWGRFNVQLDASGFLFRVIEKMMNWRSCLTGIVTGDHAVFISKKLFGRVGGFPDIALMEDIAVSRKLRKFVKPRCLSSAVVTSSRRWEQGGVVSTILLMWRLRLAYFLGENPCKLNQRYRSVR
ncbi:MAG: glycosyl transferase [Cycloclasticus sp. symbiont of Poecilosclerida sp. M]|nr:MAG: glycosyl transferase [Cycloclasticus sp. symbiont of Poecilosclerida sp. M]